MAFTSYKLSEDAVEKLRSLIEPKYPDAPSTFHATHKFGTHKDSPIPDAEEIRIIGVADDNNGIQALVVTIDDRTHNENGFQYHITWSLDRSKTADAAIDKHPDPEKRKERPYSPMHSNGVIREYGFTPLDDPIIITDFTAGYEERSNKPATTQSFTDSADPEEKDENTVLNHSGSASTTEISTQKPKV